MCKWPAQFTSLGNLSGAHTPGSLSLEEEEDGMEEAERAAPEITLGGFQEDPIYLPARAIGWPLYLLHSPLIAVALLGLSVG